MRLGKLVWAAIGFAAAAFLAEYFLPVRGLPLIAAALVVLSAAVFLLKRQYRRPVLTLLLCAAAGLLAWYGRYELRVAPCEALAGQDVIVRARVTDYPVVSDNYTRVAVTVTDGAPRERAYFYLYHDELPELRPGDVIEAEVRVTSAMDREGERYHTNTAAGRNLTGYFRELPAVVGRWEHSWIYFPQEIAHYVGETCLELFPGRTGIFMKALLTGDKEELYDEVPLYGSLRQSGMLHAVAVSGMHIFVLIALLQLLLGRSRRTSLLCLPVMGFFVLMAGCGASVVRAAVMQAIYMAAPVFRRESDSASGVAASALLLLIINPMSIGGVGMQLSYACILGYAVFLPRLHRRVEERRFFRRSRVLDYILVSLICTGCATVFSIPVSAYYFGAVSVLSPLANLLTLPVIEICFGAGYVICAVSAVFSAGAAVLAWFVSWAVRYCLLVFRCIARIPFACLYTVDPAAVVMLIVLYALLIFLISTRKTGFWRGTAVFLLACVLGVSAVVSVSALRLYHGRRELTVLDVGQGQCVTLLDSSAAVVVDCGGTGWTDPGTVAADYLLAAGKRRVDALVLTHLHEDHTNGVEALLYRVPVERIILPADAEDDGETLDRLLNMAERYGAEVLRPAEDTAATVGDFSLTLLQPQAGTEENERGIVVLAECGGVRALIPGDAGENCELAMIANRQTPDVDIIVAGHHGSKSASNPLFLMAARPEICLVSAGAHNSYNLPNEEIVARMEDHGAQVFCTAEDGNLTISLKTDG